MSNSPTEPPRTLRLRSTNERAINAKLAESVVDALGWNPRRVELTALPTKPGGSRAWTARNLNASSPGGCVLVRSATGDRRELVNQVADCARFASDSGLSLGTVIVASGGGDAGRTDRADLVYLDALRAAGQLRCLVVRDVGRISRDGSVATSLLHGMDAAHVAVHVASFGRAIHLAYDEMAIKAMSMVSDIEARRVRERMQRGRERKRRRPGA